MRLRFGMTNSEIRHLLTLKVNMRIETVDEKNKGGNLKKCLSQLKTSRQENG